MKQTAKRPFLPLVIPPRPAFSLGEGEPLAVDEVYHHCPISSLLSLCHCERSVAIPSSFNTPPAFSLGEGERLAVDEVYHHCPTSSLLSLCHCERSVAIPSSVHPAIQLRSLAVMHSPLRLSKNFATLLKISIWANSFKNTSSVKPAKVNAEVSLSPSLACLRK